MAWHFMSMQADAALSGVTGIHHWDRHDIRFPRRIFMIDNV
ncbi:hypothetical protein [Rhodocaloribacter sp.]